MFGGSGRDAFIFNNWQSSTYEERIYRDAPRNVTFESYISGRGTIYGFSRAEHDRIDLRKIDANSKAGFSGRPGDLRYEKHGAASYIYGEVDGDRRADLVILLKHIKLLQKADFWL